ncbi:hypothetical protein PRIPAC_79056 [Pristionchus pacificus]|uniref:Uncharacterized protein n=1 Tax=Pristionchus pacificus TaxID=54126 RepID=A0A2A6C3W1_PRIPA|nr:hypothetical protein PRIPAC_79056 [Pristionchus pacificus]|eukprot:PDM72733.1 hypothetical protein PRIPAC_39167 [Pristionchus pacificus]
MGKILPIVISTLENPKTQSFRELTFLTCANSCLILSQTASYIVRLAGAGTTEAELGTFFSNLLDICAFSIRETYLIARAMMPVYCLSTLLKVRTLNSLSYEVLFNQIFIIAANWMYVVSIVPLTVSQCIYLSLSEISCGLTSSMFLSHHVRLRSKLDRILGRSNRVISIIEDHQQENTQAHHFQTFHANFDVLVDRCPTTRILYGGMDFGPDAYILTWYIPIWLTTTCFELGISLERGAETTEATLCTIFSNLMDISAFSTNVIVLLFARRKNNEEHKHLNERYQANFNTIFFFIREGYLIARAMMPVYCMSSALKVVIIFINWMYVTSILPHTVTEVIYLSVSPTEKNEK